MTDDDLTGLSKYLSPARWILGAVALVCLVVAVLLIANGLGWRWDPFNMAERRADRAETAAATATSNASARSAEVAGAQETTSKVEAAHDQIRAADAVIANNIVAAKAAPDANENLEPDRVARHNDVTRQLCDIRPSVCPGYTAAP